MLFAAAAFSPCVLCALRQGSRWSYEDYFAGHYFYTGDEDYFFYTGGEDYFYTGDVDSFFFGASSANRFGYLGSDVRAFSSSPSVSFEPARYRADQFGAELFFALNAVSGCGYALFESAVFYFKLFCGLLFLAVGAGGGPQALVRGDRPHWSQVWLPEVRRRVTIHPSPWS